MNKVVLFGRIGQKPELKKTKNDNSVTMLSVATNSRVKKGDLWEDKTDWHRVVVWGRRAEVICDLLGKGSQVLVEGKLETREWEKDGERRYSTEVIASSVEFTDKSDASRRPLSEEEPPPAPKKRQEKNSGWEEMEIPF